MVRITNNSSTKVVTRGAYEQFYKPLGYYIIDDNDNKQEKQIIEDKKQDDELIKTLKENIVDKETKKSPKTENNKKR